MEGVKLLSRIPEDQKLRRKKRIYGSIDCVAKDKEEKE